MNDETLILFYYNDTLTAAERRKIAAALESDAELARRYRDLTRDLDALSEPADVPMPPGLEQRLHSSLQRAARLEGPERAPRAASFHSWSFALGAGMAAALALGIGIAVWLSGGEETGPQLTVRSTPAATVEWSQAAFQRGLESHLRSARMSLGDLGGAEDPERAALATSVLERNRAYQELALQNGRPDLARVLRSFEPMLAELGSEALSAQEAAALQAQLEFEFSVVLTKLAGAASQETGPNNQELKL